MDLEIVYDDIAERHGQPTLPFDALKRFIRLGVTPDQYDRILDLVDAGCLRG